MVMENIININEYNDLINESNIIRNEIEEIDKDIISSNNGIKVAGKNINGALIAAGASIVWVFLTEDIKSNLIRANIRSVGPYINDVATKFGGGGHKYASGVKLKTWDDSDKLINELDELVKNYKN
jgi:nanoRNase/pAp phosphatase (c-di-AMP/oligoRNAs hydrolase)